MRRKRTLSLALSLGMILTSIPVAALATSVLSPNGEETQAGDVPQFVSGVIPQVTGIVFPSAEMVEKAPRKPGSANLDSLPASFDSRDYNLQTGVKNQGSNGICWAFGSIAAVEANMLKDGYGEQDLAEQHMAYATSNSSNNTIQGWSRSPSDGGNRYYSSSYMMRGTTLSGMVNENDDAYKNVSTILQNRDLSVTQGKPKSYTVQNIGFMNEGKKPSTATEINALKAAVMDYGGLDASLYWVGNATANTTGNRYYNPDTAAYYYNGAETINYEDGTLARLNVTHEVEIVGWDDNYSVENFNENFRPSHSGAWLVKNSWGENWGQNGYFWISYEDTNFPLDVTYIDGVQPYDGSTTVYESDYKVDGHYIYVNNPGRFERVFTVNQSGEQLRSIKVMVAGGAVDIEADAIADFSNYNNYTFHSKSETIHATYPGWYTIDFNEPIALGDADSKFAVIVRMTSVDPNITTVNIGFDAENSVGYGMSTSVNETKNVDQYNLAIKAVTTTLSDEEAVAAAKNEITWDLIKNKNESRDAVRTELLLPLYSVNGTKITWSSDNAAISDTGIVTRNTENTPVTLTATITKGDAISTVEFYLTVIGVPAAERDRVTDAKANLTWDKISNEEQNAVTSNLTLPIMLEGYDDVKIVWSTSQAIDETKGGISVDGAVTRPRFDVGDISVTLTATLTYGEASDTVDFITTVKAAGATDEIRLSAAKDWILGSEPTRWWSLIGGNNVSKDQIRSDLVNPSNIEIPYEDVTVVGASADVKGYITDEGKVTRPDYGMDDVNGSFYLLLKSGDLEPSLIDSYPVIVLSYKGIVQIDEQPTSTLTATAGSGILSVSGSVKEGIPGDILYQWYEADDATAGNGTIIDGATDAEFTIPANATDGVHYYYCEVSALDAAPVLSNVSTVTVTGITTPFIQGTSLTLEGQIGVNFYVLLPAEIANSGYAKFTFNGEESDAVAASDVKVTTGDYAGAYKFTYRVAAKEMHDTITLKLYDKDNKALDMLNSVNETIAADAGYAYSVSKYLNDVHSLELDERLQDLTNAMGVYGNHAQKQFDYDVDTVTDTDDSALEAVTLDNLTDYALEQKSDIPNGLTLEGMTLMLESETAIRLYFITNDTDDYTFTCEGKTLEAGQKAEDVNDNKYYIEIPESEFKIAAKDLGKAYTVSINGTETITCSALSYGYAVLKQDETDDTKDLHDLIKSLYLYYQAANAYFYE